jgi:hypothetical protein
MQHTCGEKYAYRILIGRPEEERLLGRLRLWWGDNIKIDFRGMEWLVRI